MAENEEPIGGHRVIVKFRPEIQLPYTDSASEQLKNKTGNAWSELTELFPGIRLEPYFATIPLAILRKFDRLRPAFGTEPFAFTSYFAIVNAANLNRKAIVQKLQNWKAVEAAYIEPGLVRPPADIDPMNVDQKYQDNALIGIGSRQFSIDTGILGANVGFVDVEQGWMLDHEDLLAAAIPPPIWGENRNEKPHGTAVLGIVVATADNEFGGKGIAPAAATSVVSILKPGVLDIAFTASAILHAACALLPGDVMLLEVQTRRSDGGNQLVPVEADLAVFNAIRAVTSLGITVVEAGANGAVDLDLLEVDRKLIFKRGHADFRDSGAILVGAAQSADRKPEVTSNFGSRINCFAWGDGIHTTDSDTTGMTSQYMGTFGQTSGASAIVAGAAILLQSWRRQVSVGPFSVPYLRDLLSHPDLNTPSFDKVKDRIGVMPNLQAIRNHVETQDALSLGPAVAELAKRAARKSDAKRLAKLARRIQKGAAKKRRRKR